MPRSSLSRSARLTMLAATILASIILSSMLLLGAARAETVTWASDGTGDWRAAENWSPRLPAPDDDVIIDRPSAEPAVWLREGDDFSVASLTQEENLVVSGGSLTLTAGDSISRGTWTHSAGGLTVANPQTTFTAIGPTHLTGGSLRATAGGALLAPGAMAHVGGSGASTGLVADGNSSRLDLSSVAALAGSSGGWLTRIAAEAGGRVDLHGLATIEGGATLIESLGAGSVVDLSALDRFWGDSSQAVSGIHVNNGVVSTPRLSDIRDIYLHVDGSGSIDAQAIARAERCSFYAGFGRLEFPALTAFATSEATVSQIVPIGATGYIGFPALATLQETAGTIQAWAVAGATLDFPALATVGGGAVDIRADNWGSLVDLPALTEFDPPGGGFLRATSGGVIRINPSGTTTVANTEVELTPLGRIEVGTLVLGSESRLTRIGALSGSLTNAAGTIDPHKLLAGQQTIDGSLVQEAAGVLRVDLGGTAPGDEYDQFVVTGSATLDGWLVVNRIGGFAPAFGDRFRILTAATVEGSLAIAPPGPASTGFDAGSPSLIFATFVDAAGLELRVVLAGDANFDGVVSGGDFTVWSDHFGQSDAGYAAGDFNSDGLVSGDDFTLWADHFGALAPQAATAVPEPAAADLAMVAGVAALALCSGRSRQHSFLAYCRRSQRHKPSSPGNSTRSVTFA